MTAGAPLRSFNYVVSPNEMHEAAMRGWIYSYIIDPQFIDPSLRKLFPRNTSALLPDDASCDTDDAEKAVASLLNGNTPEAIYQILRDLTQIPSASSTHDSFIGQQATFRQALNAVFQQSTLNILIIGAGCTGLTLASALKRHIGVRSAILVLENRITRSNVKQIYSRQWPTMIPTSLMDDLVDERFNHIAKQVGQNGYIGLHLNMLETLLFLLNKANGVKFYFDQVADFSAIADKKIDIVFDATGGKLRNNTQLEPLRAGPTFTVRDIVNYADGYRVFGAHQVECIRRLDIRTVCSKTHIFPAIDNLPVKVACVKVTALPIQSYQKLIDLSRNRLYQSRLYVWPDRLRGALNRILLMVNLHRQEYEEIAKLVAGHSIELGRLVASLRLTGGTIEALFEEILSIDPRHADALVEFPFLFEPYLCPYESKELFFNRPVVRIGDSLFNGNPKTGNGLSFHLHHIRQVLRRVIELFP